jgi:hypothetical protein
MPTVGIHYKKKNMRKIITITTLMLIINIVFAQQNKDLSISTINITMYSSDFDKSNEILKTYLQETNSEITLYKKTETELKCIFYLDNINKPKFDSIIKKIGYSQELELLTTYYTKKRKEINSDIEYKTKRKKEYENEINIKRNNNKEYDKYWLEVRKLEKELYELHKEYNSINSNHDYLVTIKIYDDNVDLTNGAVKWVNMPGVSYEMLWTENPTLGISNSIYRGFSLKYLFTKGKSYAKIGALKSYNNSNDTLSAFTELFQFSFGQDFYTKHFGRGEHKFLNLYSGYDLGGIIATGSDKPNTFLPFIKIHLGLELFKSKHILLDNKVSYFVPFVNNREFRGLVYSVSFNFVF